MTTLDSLLHTILARPECDNVRLVYADALEEVGNGERAEFIRVQIELAKCPPEVRADRRWGDLRYMVAEPWDRLRRRDKELSDNCLDWFADAVPPGGSCHWERGFVSSVRCSLAAWCGEECERCHGSGNVQVYTRDGDYNLDDCWECKGTGRTPGHGAEIVARHPVGLVEFTDAEPIMGSPLVEFLEPSNLMTPEVTREDISSTAIRWARAEAVRRGLVPDVWSKT